MAADLEQRRERLAAKLAAEEAQLQQEFMDLQARLFAHALQGPASRLSIRERGRDRERPGCGRSSSTCRHALHMRSRVLHRG